jgi:S1-C subfamily serine protease
MKLIKVAGFLFQFGLIGLALAVIYLVTVSDRSKDEILSFLTSSPVPGQAVSNGGSVVFSYADAVASSAPSVVTIYTSKTVTEKPHPLLDDPVFSQFFGDQLKRRQRSHNETNLGSGVIIGADGYILTNQHVIDGADEILISLTDGRGSQAVLIGEDKDTDIAILQIPITGLVGIKIADTQAIRVGDVVLAIGNPLNVGQTVTMGIVSATGRNRIGLNTFENRKFHPDRRRHQPGQLRRCIDQCARGTHRHQYRDLQPDGWRPGHWLRDTDFAGTRYHAANYRFR